MDSTIKQAGFGFLGKPNTHRCNSLDSLSPQHFNQSCAGRFGYWISIALATDFVDYGNAGLCRRLFVYLLCCVWPASLVTIVLNNSLHDSQQSTVRQATAKITH